MITSLPFLNPRRLAWAIVFSVLALRAPAAAAQEAMPPAAGSGARAVGGGAIAHGTTAAPQRLAKLDAGQRFAVLIENGRAMKPTLLQHCRFDAKHIEEVEPSRAAVEAALRRVAAKAGDNDLVFIAICGHAARGCYLRDGPWAELQGWLKPVKGCVVLLLETCHGGAALKAVPAAAVVFASCNADEKCGGIFFSCVHEALAKAKGADANGDGRVSLAEAYAYAAEQKRLNTGYLALSKSDPKFWPYPTGPTPVRRQDLDTTRIWLERPVERKGPALGPRK